ncbi:MAG: response regulator transcription factor [Flavobacteriales bacterium]|nr:response regulator transcription factor [Flavobacteriales bacterium]
MYKTIIVDDEKGCRDTLENLLKEFPNIEIVAIVNSIALAQETIKNLQPHLVFLDIEMPGGTGFELLEVFNPINFDIIFTTAYDQYAIKAIKYSALDYLLKPIDPTELEETINRFSSKKHDQDLINNQFKTLLNNIGGETSHQKIAIPDGEGISFVKIADITHFQSDGSYTYMHLIGNKKPTLISKPIGDYQEMLENESFIRIHRSYLVNIQHVEKYIKGDGGYTIMSDGTKIEVSRRKKVDFIQALSTL